MMHNNDWFDDPSNDTDRDEFWNELTMGFRNYEEFTSDYPLYYHDFINSLENNSTKKGTFVEAYTGEEIIGQMPPEVIHTISGFLDIASISKFMRTSKKIKNILDDNIFWKNLARRDFKCRASFANPEFGWREAYRSLLTDITIYISAALSKKTSFKISVRAPFLAGMTFLCSYEKLSNHGLSKQSKNPGQIKGYIDIKLWIDQDGKLVEIPSCCSKCGPRSLLFNTRDITFSPEGLSQIHTSPFFLRNHLKKWKERLYIQTEYILSNGKKLTSNLEEIKTKGSKQKRKREEGDGADSKGTQSLANKTAKTAQISQPGNENIKSNLSKENTVQ